MADLAAQLVTLGPWKVVYDQLRIMNGPWFDQHATKPPEQLAGKGKWSVITHGCCVGGFNWRQHASAPNECLDTAPWL